MAAFVICWNIEIQENSKLHRVLSSCNPKPVPQEEAKVEGEAIPDPSRAVISPFPPSIHPPPSLSLSLFSHSLACASQRQTHTVAFWQDMEVPPPEVVAQEEAKKREAEAAAARAKEEEDARVRAEVASPLSRRAFAVRCLLLTSSAPFRQRQRPALRRRRGWQLRRR